MESIREGSSMFIRVDPGESMMETLRTVAQDEQIPAAAIVSGVGMLTEVKFGFFDVQIDDYRPISKQGIYDISSIQGNIIREPNGNHVPHVHLVVNDASMKTLGGHLMDARCHVTMEIFLTVLELPLVRRKVKGCPATRILRAS